MVGWLWFVSTEIFTSQVIGVSGVESEKMITVTDAGGKEVTTSKPVDFLSSALSQAQIDLDPYQFIEEDEPSSFTKTSQGTCIFASFLFP